MSHHTSNRQTRRYRYTTLWNINVRKQKQAEVYHVILDISQGIIPTEFRSGETSKYDFISCLLFSLLWTNF